MDDADRNILAKILKKRLESLGYASLKKFHADRPDLGYSYELLRQVVYTGRIPRTETLREILRALRFSSSQAGKIMDLSDRGYPGRGTAEANPPDAGGPPAGAENGPGGPQDARTSPQPPADDGSLPSRLFPLEGPEEIASSLLRSLPKIPLQGNEDFWDMLKSLAEVADRKVVARARRGTDQPLLFEKEPEAVYQFLLRNGKVPPYMSKGEGLPLAFTGTIDYGDRFRGALLGAAVGETLGRASQGLSPRDIEEIYGRIGAGHSPAGGSGRKKSPPAVLLLARELLGSGRIDPVEAAASYAAGWGTVPSGSLAEFSRNLSDRGYPWFEAGVNAAESAPAARIAPLALLRGGNFRLMKLEAGIDASITHPNPASIAGSIAQAAAVARVLHSPAGTLDVLGFARGLSHVVSGIEPDRASRGKPAARPHATLWRKLGTELTALLLRRAEIDEIRDAIGNGTAVVEGLPFAWACFLRYPDDFASGILAAVNMGNDSESTAAIAGAVGGAYTGESGIPAGFLEDLPWREELEAAADGLLALARRDS